MKEIVQEANRVLRLELEGWMNWVQCCFVFHGCFPLLMIAAICGRLHIATSVPTEFERRKSTSRALPSLNVLSNAQNMNRCLLFCCHLVHILSEQEFPNDFTRVSARLMLPRHFNAPNKTVCNCTTSTQACYTHRFASLFCMSSLPSNTKLRHSCQSK